LWSGFEFKPMKVGIGTGPFQLLKSPAPSPMCSQYPEEYRFSAEKRHSKRFFISRKQFFSGYCTPKRSTDRSRHNKGKTVIEPDHARCSRPYEIANGPVIPVDDPALKRNGILYQRTELLQRFFYPIRIPMQGIQFNVRRPEDFREPLCV
jgi:hypothetical protein